MKKTVKQNPVRILKVEKNRLDAVVFDIDGTLTYTNELIFKSINHVYRVHRGKELTPAEVIAMFGPTEEELFEKEFGGEADKVAVDYFSYYSDNHHIAGLYPGLTEILKHLKRRGVFLGVFTGKGRRSATITLDKTGISDYFDLLIAGDDVENKKPSGEGLKKILEKSGAAPERTLMIGDAPGDVKASRDAGVKVASVLWDSYAKEKVEALGSDHYVYTVDELKELIYEYTGGAETN